MSAPEIINPATASGLPPAGVFGTGTIGTITKFSGTTTIANSVLSENGTGTGLLLGTNIGSRTFTNTKFVVTQVSGGVNEGQAIGLFAEAQGTASGDSAGVYGHGWTYPGLVAGGLVAGITGEGRASGSTDVSSAIGVRGYSNDTHAGGSNIALYGNATNGATNYALYMNAGNIFSNVAQTWTLAAGSTSALNIQSGLLNLDTTNSRVGIGTASPSAQLHISRAGGTSNAEFMRLTNTTVATNSACGITFFQNNAAVPVNRIEGTITAAGSYDLVSYAWNGVSTAEVTRLQGSTGNVGIGTASPTKKLDVNGAANVTGALTVAGSVSRISGSTAGVLNGAFIVVAVPEVAKAFLLTSTTTNNKQLSSLHLVGSDAATAGVAALYTFQTTVAINGAGSVKITNTSGSTVTIEWSFLQIS